MLICNYYCFVVWFWYRLVLVLSTVVLGFGLVCLHTTSFWVIWVC